jgi:hypothetical protein
MLEGLQRTHHHDGHPATLSAHAPPNDAAGTFATPRHQRRTCVITPLVHGVEVCNWPPEAAATAPLGIRLLVRR